MLRTLLEAETVALDDVKVMFESVVIGPVILALGGRRVRNSRSSPFILSLVVSSKPTWAA